MSETSEQRTRGAGQQARQKAGEVAGAVGDQARSAARDLGGRAAEEARDQARNTTGTVRQWADELTAMAENGPHDSPARALVAQAADGGHRAADYLDQRGIGGMTEDVQEFARQRPAAFLGGAALAGFAVGRLVRAGRAQSQAAQDGGPRTEGG